MRLVERAVVDVGQRRAFAAEVVVRSELLPQLAIPDRQEAVQGADGGRSSVDRPELPELPHRDGHHDVHEQIAGHPQKTLRHRESGKQLLRGRTEGEVELRHDPDRGALVDGQLGDVLGELGDQLDPGGPGADDRRLRAAQRVVIVPLLGMQNRAGEILDTRDVGLLRLAQVAGGQDQELSPQRLATLQRHLPGLRLLVPACTVHRGVEAHVAPQVVLVGHVIGVGLELGARGVEPRPVRVRFEPVRVRGGGDVDRQARIPVDMPGTAEIVLPVEEDDPAVPKPVELDRGAHSAESRADDDSVELLGTHVAILRAFTGVLAGVTAVAVLLAVTTVGLARAGLGGRTVATGVTLAELRSLLGRRRVVR